MDNLSEKKIEDLIPQLSTILKEINLMNYISQLDCDYILRLRGVGFHIDENKNFKIAILTDLLR
jgi:hypothetical protein